MKKRPEMGDGQCPRLARSLIGHVVKLAMIYGLARAIPLVVVRAVDQAGVGGQVRCAIAVIWIVLLFIAARIVRRAWNEISVACEKWLTAVLRNLKRDNKQREASGQSADGAHMR
ncbi:TPA: hypothetical protein ACU9T0_005968 [Burkholderia cenocepacia]|uniref:Uncharacterized protein n=1 Tax=Burkholderia vietnamiensis TaxID=60552 RepID=A0ABS1AXQ7_BURVI|nr:hypothetical protein [Burkholderia vietnamiensis]MBJ9688872.1 hypothetical protein [Burkholderia vietnamiensis]